jgi:hypothetical protein
MELLNWLTDGLDERREVRWDIQRRKQIRGILDYWIKICMAKARSFG